MADNNLKEQQTKLFTNWKVAYQITPFIQDGVVCEEIFTQQKKHILFVLRDMNSSTECDLCEALRTHGSGWKTWNNVGRWTKALLDGEEEYPRDMSSTKRVEQLKRIAVMNLKKQGGGSRTSAEALEEAVKAQHENIYQQLRFYIPDLIVCCGLSSGKMKGNAVLMKEYVFPAGSTTEWEEVEFQNRTWWYYEAVIENRTIPVISFCHPQVTVLGQKRGHKDLFIPLYQDMLEIRKKWLEKAK